MYVQDMGLPPARSRVSWSGAFLFVLVFSTASLVRACWIYPAPVPVFGITTADTSTVHADSVIRWIEGGDIAASRGALR